MRKDWFDKLIDEEIERIENNWPRYSKEHNVYRYRGTDFRYAIVVDGEDYYYNEQNAVLAAVKNAVKAGSHGKVYGDKFKVLATF